MGWISRVFLAGERGWKSVARVGAARATARFRCIQAGGNGGNRRRGRRKVAVANVYYPTRTMVLSRRGRSGGQRRPRAHVRTCASAAGECTLNCPSSSATLSMKRPSPDSCCRVKFDVKRVAVTEERPWGLRYSLTLHAPDGLRLMGYDNAHGGVKPPGSAFKVAGKRFPFDHRHRYPTDPGVYYEFRSGYKLIEDFYNGVNRVVEELAS